MSRLLPLFIQLGSFVVTYTTCAVREFLLPRQQVLDISSMTMRHINGSRSRVLSAPVPYLQLTCNISGDCHPRQNASSALGLHWLRG